MSETTYVLRTYVQYEKANILHYMCMCIHVYLSGDFERLCGGVVPLSPPRLAEGGGGGLREAEEEEEREGTLELGSCCSSFVAQVLIRSLSSL